MLRIGHFPCHEICTHCNGAHLGFNTGLNACITQYSNAINLSDISAQRHKHLYQEKSIPGKLDQDLHHIEQHGCFEMVVFSKQQTNGFKSCRNKSRVYFLPIRTQHKSSRNVNVSCCTIVNHVY